ncbi:MAG: hypothetical protein QOH21_707 [Acidobacteriota bacterium]|jgi:hypothetical protein|nr:hypothetical protein [Acidobacteriota bacterium]
MEPKEPTENEPNKMLSSIRALLEEAPPGPAELVDVLRLTGEHVPDYGPLDLSTKLSLRAVSAANPLFVQATINTVGASKNMESMIGKTAEELRQETEEAARWTAVEDELRTTLSGVAAANLVRRHRIGLRALQTYNAAQQLVRAKEHAHLLPFIAEMKRLNRFGKKRAVKAAVPPVPVTAPAPPPATPQK